MKHARNDYDRIQDPDGHIPEDEPVFLLRAQDSAAPTVLDVWADIVEAMGAHSSIAEKARMQARDMRFWQQEHGKKVPDL